MVWSGRLADEALERTAIASGLRRRGDYEVLALLRRVEPTLLTPLQVAQQLLGSQSDMTGKLDQLEEQGLIQRTPDPNDRRAVGLGITDSGRALVDDAFTKNLSVYESMLDDLSSTEVKGLAALLDKLLKRMDHLSRMRSPGLRARSPLGRLGHTCAIGDRRRDSLRLRSVSGVPNG